MFGYHSRFVRETLSEISTGDQPTRTNAKAGDKVGCFETRDQGSINLKRLGEFAAVHTLMAGIRGSRSQSHRLPRAKQAMIPK